MKYRRYGKFRFRNIGEFCITITTLLLFSIIGFIFDAPIFPTIAFFLMAIGKAIGVLLPYRESFTLEHDRIVINDGKESISLSSPLVLIVSYADLCTSFAKKVSIGNRTYMLKDSYSVSILKDISLQDTLNILHSGHGFIYTNCWVEEIFKNNFVYSFVFNKDVLEALRVHTDCIVIIPASVMDLVDTSCLGNKIYIDEWAKKTGDGSMSSGSDD